MYFEFSVPRRMTASIPSPIHHRLQPLLVEKDWLARHGVSTPEMLLDANSCLEQALFGA